MDAMNEREAFEMWAKNRWGVHAWRHTSATSGEWEAWQAALAERPVKKHLLLHCQNCGLTRITGSGPCDECGAEDFRTFDKLTNRITGEPLVAPEAPEGKTALDSPSSGSMPESN
ncbi:MAG TPA: hypothetical protein VFN11_00710 [Ktedonobacterales bacterium]|nr:hypothetical protein [Ktedonobacterales bacterium]